MKIAVNTRFLLKDKLEGIGWFTYETMKRIVDDHPEDEFHFIFDRPFDKRFTWAKNIIPHVVYPPARHPILWKIWFEYSVPRVLNRIKPDLFYSPDGYNSLRSPWKSVVTIHDVAFEYYPEFVSSGVAKYYKKYTPLFLKKADRVLTVSHNTKKDLEKLYGIQPEKIDVTCNGCRDIFKPLSNEQKETVRNELTGGDPYFLFIGAIHPRKNVEGILRAFELYKKANPSNHKLILLGRMAWQTKDLELLQSSLDCRDDIIHLPHAGEEIYTILGAAEALLYPSFYEGFGIPIIEAFHAEVPVITSNVSSMPEVAGKAAILVDPHAPEEIMNAMSDITGSQKLKNSLLNKGKTQKEQYSWNKAAAIIYESWTKAISENP